VLLETFIRKLLKLKAPRVTAVEPSPEQMVIRIDRLGRRRRRCRVCRKPCPRVHHVEEARSWRDLSLHGLPLVLRYRPRRVHCLRGGVRVEEVSWARPPPALVHGRNGRSGCREEVGRDEAGASVEERAGTAAEGVLALAGGEKIEGQRFCLAARRGERD